MQVLKAKEVVENLLKTRPELRDDDRALIAAVWTMAAEQRYVKPTYEVSLQEFLRGYVKGGFVSAESIRRSRAKLQQDHPELRGEKYEERHKVREPQVREELKDLPPGELTMLVSGKDLQQSLTDEDISNAARTLSKAKTVKLKMREAMNPGDQGLGQTSLFNQSEDEQE